MGFETEILAEKIDWIAYTQKIGDVWAFPDYIDNHWKSISPLRNYTHGEENKQEMRRYWNTENTTQGRMVVFGGSASASLGENQEQFLLWLNSGTMKPTRIDYALDILHSNFNPKGSVQHLRNRLVVTHAHSARQVTDEFKGGFTQYVGLKTSETYTRIYDKAIEQNVDFNWTRIETVYQGSRAEASLAAYIQCKSTRPLIKAHVDFPKWRAWQRVMQGDLVHLTIAPRTTRTRAWLLSQVAKSLAREIAMDEGHEFWFEFRERVISEYTLLEENSGTIDF